MSKRLLIVEDHADLRRLIRITLGALNYEIFEASDGDEAVRRMDSISPNVVILDVMMRGRLDGLDVCRWIRASSLHRQAQVILLSARAQASDIEAGMAAGADDYLSKPFSPLELIQRLAEQRQRA